MRPCVAGVFALLSVLALCACGSGGERFEATGRVVSADTGRRIIKVSHDDIPGFMPAMTMNFDVAPGVAIGDLGKGDAIRFVIERTPERLRIVDLERGGPEGAYGIDRGADDAEAGADPLASREAPPVRLTDQEGRVFDLASLRGRAVLLDFVFTRCTGPCPILTNARVRLQKQIPPELVDRVHFVSITVDPVNDSPAVLKRYARSHDADLATWSFLTGAVKEVDRVLQSYHVGRVRLPDKTLNHTVVTYLIDPAGKIRNYYLGLEHGQDALLADLLEVIS